MYDRWEDTTATPADTLLLELLREEAMWGTDAPRQDELYSWVVHRPDRPPAVPASCGASGAAYQVSLRTMSDHQVVIWMEGAGIVAYLFGHHGTPAWADVVLMDCGAPTEGRTRPSKGG